MAQAAVRLNQQLEECDTGLFPLHCTARSDNPKELFYCLDSWSCMEGVYSHWLCGFPDQTFTTLYLFWIGSKVLVSFLLFVFWFCQVILSVVVHFSPKKGVSILCSTFQLKLLWWGPLILLHGFHPGLLQICSMHVINLGLLFDLNGAGLTLGLLIGLTIALLCNYHSYFRDRWYKKHRADLHAAGAR